MGLAAQLISVVKSYIDNRNGGPGVTMYVEGQGLGKAGLNAEVYQAPGIISRPTKGAKGVFLPVGPGQRYGIVIGLHNYKVVVTPGEGGTTTYSTDSTGATVQAKIELDNAGKIRISNATQSLKSQLDSLLTALSAFATTCATSQTDPILAGAATTLGPLLTATKAQIALLLKD